MLPICLLAGLHGRASSPDFDRPSGRFSFGFLAPAFGTAILAISVRDDLAHVRLFVGPKRLDWHGIPAPYWQPNLSSVQGELGWFSPTQPRPKQWGHFGFIVPYTAPLRACLRPSHRHPNFLMRAGFLPLLKVRLSVAGSLLFLRISFPGLVRLLAGAPVGPLARIGVRCFFAQILPPRKTSSAGQKGS